jgi:hypothetical protein
MRDMTERAIYSAEVEHIKKYGPLDLADITVDSNGDKEE